jgi:hypothetical protein
MSTPATLAPDAAMALGIAATAMPFARTSEGEAERWLRVLRLHGEAGIALQGLGVSEGLSEGSGESHAREPDTPAGAAAGDAVARVTEQAFDIASQRGAGGVGTKDLLVAVMRVYGEDFDRVLRAHGTDRDEVLERLAAGPDRPA